jgi:GPH family glycoside/pentoside/hexuronide:cation symporter
VLNDEAAAPASMALSTAVGLVVVPLWIWVERWLGKRLAWMSAAAIGLVVLAYFCSRDSVSTREFTVICVLVNAALYGSTVSMWSMLPDTIEFGELHRGVRIEAPAFGFALFVLKLAMGIATALSGVILDSTGFAPNASLSSAAIGGLTFVVGGLPMAIVAIGLIAGFFYPMRKGDHERIVAELSARYPRFEKTVGRSDVAGSPLEPTPILTE